MFRDVRGEPATADLRVRRALMAVGSRLASIWMGLLILIGGRPLTDPNNDVVVSLTSYGRRVHICAKAIESIGRGKVRPSRIILWIDENDTMANLPRSLRRQIERGLEVRHCENFGSHKKYFPLVEEMSTQGFRSFATADDDVIYSRDWLELLQSACRASVAPVVVCHRAHVITTSKGRIDPYDQWPSALSSATLPNIFPTGVSGVLYPPEMAEILHSAGRGFEAHCSQTDDVWLHRLALANGINVRQAADYPRHFWSIPRTHRGSLLVTNSKGGNDAAIAATYLESDIKILELSHQCL